MPNYWQNDRVKLDGVEWLYIANDNTRVLKLQAGEVDAILFVPFNQIDSLGKDPERRHPSRSLEPRRPHAAEPRP